MGDAYDGPNYNDDTTSGPSGGDNYFAQFENAPAATAPASSDNYFAQFEQPPQQKPPDNYFAQFEQQPGQPELPKAESPFWSGVREFAHAVGPTLAGAAAGAATMGGYGTVAGTMGWPGLGTLVGGGIGLVGGLITGGIAGYAAGKAQDVGAKAFGIDDDLLRTANAQANPGSTLLGGALPAVVPFGMGRGAVTLGQRAFSGALMGGTEVGSQYAEGRPFDPAAVALSTGLGAAFPQPRAFLNPVEAAGARLGTRLAEQFHGKAGPDAAGGVAQEQPSPKAGTTIEPGAAAATPEATAPAGDRGGPEDYGKAREPPAEPALAEQSATNTDPALDAAIRAKMEPEGKPTVAAPEDRDMKAAAAWHDMGLDQTDRELLRAQLEARLNKNGKLTYDDLDRDLTNKLDTTTLAGLKQSLAENPRRALDALHPIEQSAPAAPAGQPPPEQAPAAPAAPSVAAEPVAPAPAPATPAIRKLGDIEIAKNPDGPGYVVRRGDDVLSEHDTLRQANARMVKQANAASPADKALPSFYEQQKAQAQAQFAKEAVRRVGDIAIVKNPDGPGYVVMRGDDILSQHNNIGQAHMGLNRAVKQANLRLPPDEAFAPAPAPAAPAAPAPAPVRTRPEGVVPVKGRGPRAKDEQLYSLLEYLAHNGGLQKDIPELKDIFGGKNRLIPGFGNLLRKNGMSLDQAWLKATREGRYLNDASDFEGRVAKTTTSDLLDLIDKEARGARQYRVGSEGTTTAGERERAAELNRVAIQRAVDDFSTDAGLGALDPKIYDRTVEIMEKEGVSDPEVAHERALMEGADQYEKANKVRDDAVGHIEGWDVDDAAAARGAGAGIRQAGAGPEPAGPPAPPDAGEVPRGTVEMGAEGKPQGVIPGTERIGEGELAQRRADERLKPTAPQRPADEGLFGDTHLQGDLLAAKPTATPSPEAPEQPVRSLSAAAAPPTAPIVSTPPNTPAGKIFAGLKEAANNLFDIAHSIGRDLQMKIAPMATGTKDSMLAAKDFIIKLRQIDHDWAMADDAIVKKFNPEQQKRIWDAMNEEREMQKKGEVNEHMGVATLEPDERAFADDFHTQAQAIWARLRELGVVKGEGEPYWTPIMLAHAMEKGEAGALDRIGGNLKTTTGSLKARKYETAEETEAAMKKHFGEQAGIARNARVLPLALAKLQKVIAGRELVDKIREIGKATGTDTVALAKPNQPGWFHIDHPALYDMRIRPRMEEADTPVYREAVEGHGVVKVPPAEIPLFDRNGKPVLNYDRVPLWIRGDFEGPLRAVLTKPSGPAYQQLMSLKGKTMGLIMNSPLIHLAVEIGRALPSMPGAILSGRIFFDGNRAKYDPVTAREAIGAGQDPIGKRYFNQDVTSIMEQPDLTPGRSWTAKVLAFAPGLFDEKAGLAVKQAIDKAGDFWHNTLLWDRIRDLQMGLYVNYRDNLVAKGLSREEAAILAAHWSNRFAGALPAEAMSASARKVANLLLFSRTFTMGNLGVMKDMLTGAPKDVLAMLERAGGSQKAVDLSKSMAQRKAISIVALDMGLMYVGNSLLQSASNVMRGDKTLDQEGQGYADRLSAALKNVRENPLSMLQPLNLAQSLSATSENEPGKQDRILVGHAKDGTGIYARNPVGKIGEEFAGYLSGPLDMLRRKLGTLVRPTWQVLSNDKGFGRKVYDPNADSIGGYVKNAGAIATHFATAQLPDIQLSGAYNLLTGQGDTTLATTQALGPIAGVTFSKGAPGGLAVGEMYKEDERQRFAVNEALPEIRQMITNNDIPGAMKRMIDLKMPAWRRNTTIRETLNPSTRITPTAVRKFNQTATPAEQERFNRMRQQNIQ